MADDAGALLVRSGLISASALDEARAKVASGGGTIGEQLVEAGAVTDDALTEFYRSRFLLPQVNPNTLARLPTKVVSSLPSDMAIELRAIPVALDGENNLTVAMSDPSDRHAVDEIGFFTGTYVVRAVATQMQIAWCLAHYYGHVTPLGQRLIQPNSAAARPRRDSAAPPPPEPATPPAESAGEARVPPRRAASIKPPMPEPHAPSDDDDDDDEPMISIEATPSEEDTAKRKMVPVRRPRIVKTDPPELRARAGEVQLATGVDRPVDETGPRIIIDEEALSPPPVADVTGELRVVEHRDAAILPRASIEVDTDSIVIADHPVDHSQPYPRQAGDEVKLHPRAPASADDPEDDEIVMLDAPKRPSVEVPPLAKPRPFRSTQVGVGATPALTRAARDTEVTGGGDVAHIEDRPPRDELDATRVDGLVAPDPGDFSDETIAPPPPRRDDDTNPSVLAPAPRAASAPDDDDLDDDSVTGPATAVMSAVELDSAIPQRRDEVVPAHLDRQARARTHDYDGSEDDWGPPGSTIPPPLLGAIPGTEDLDARPGIPMPNVDSAPLLIGPPSPPESPRPGAPVAPSLMKQLEEATQRVFELIHALERAKDRDGVVALVVAHLGETHRRAGFFSIRHGSARLGPNRVNELVTFTIQPQPPTLPTAALRLDRPSTLQDVVGTRLPYRGPMLDDASRQFLAQVLGTCPPEILLVPVAVRERVVGVFFGEHRLRHTFDDQLALAARAAGSAFERALMKR